MPAAEELSNVCVQVDEYLHHAEIVSEKTSKGATALEKTWRSARDNIKMIMQRTGVPAVIARQASHVLQCSIQAPEVHGMLSSLLTFEFTIHGDSPQESLLSPSIFTLKEGGTYLHDAIEKYVAADKEALQAKFEEVSKHIESVKKSMRSPRCQHH